MRSNDTFVWEAQRLFGMYSRPGRSHSSDRYVQVSADVAESERESASKEEDAHPYTYPIRATYPVRAPTTFLAPHPGRGSNEEREASGSEPTIRDPSFTFVLGQYGVGKTELVFQLCQRLANSTAEPLPVNLALCRGQLSLLEQANVSTGISARELFALLFDRVEPRADASTESNVWEGIRQGRIVLILDGIDELVSTWKQLRALLAGLARVVAGEPSDRHRKFRVIVTMRLELLMSLGKEDGSALAQEVSNAAPHIGIHKYFLQLGFLDDSQIVEFLARSGVKAEYILARVRSNRSLLEMVRRPLLARLLCDVARPDSQENFFASLCNPAQLISAVVDGAVKDPSLVEDQSHIARGNWDIKRIAYAALRLYELGKSEFGDADILEIDVPDETRRSDDIQKTMLRIHKLPFLQLTGKNLHFAHRIFYEYFVALGMKLKEEVGDSAEFDRLVLNVDMRRLLRDLMPDRWYERTMRSYGLDSDHRAEWRAFGGLEGRSRDLEKYRRFLLDSMTEPELYATNPARRLEVETSVQWFLSNEASFHPRYLVYNYEALAVYLATQRFTDNAQSARPLFDAVLERRFATTVKYLEAGDAECREAWELVLERVLSVGVRLRSRWVKEAAAREWSPLIQNAATVRRLQTIRDDV